MANFNRFIAVGNLTRDPDYKQLASGQAVCKLGLATNRQFKNRQTGAMVQEVCFIDVDVWGAQAESCRQYLQKGRSVLIEGRLKFDSWEDPNGQTRSKHSVVADRVVFLGSSAEAEFSTQNTVTGAVRDNGASSMPEPQNEIEKELFDQIDQIKNRNTKKQADQTEATSSKSKKNDAAKNEKSDTAPDTGEIDFKDEPPFEDELPF